MNSSVISDTKNNKFYERFLQFLSWTKKVKPWKSYENFRSWLQGYAWKPFCRHWFIFDRYCKECDAKYCHKCHTKFPREYLHVRAPMGEMVHFKHNH